MPKAFDACRKAGGKIRTIKPNANTFIPICYLGGKSYRGEVHHKEGEMGDTAAAIKERMKK